MKNTLGKLAFKQAGMDVPPETMQGSTAVGLAFSDAPGVAKAIADFAKGKQAVKIKAGFLGKQFLSSDAVVQLATLPPLPVVRSQLLAMFNTPATQLTRLLAEPGRRVAQVLKAYADKPAAA
jgi:large subunit ribosomal protein L10